MFLATPSRRMRSLALLVVLLSVGCVAPGAADLNAKTPEIPSLDVAFDIDHDHEDPELHATRWNTELIAHAHPELDGLDFVTMEELDLVGAGAAANGNDASQRVGDLLLVAVNAGTTADGTTEGGFMVFDVTDATDPKLLHYERSPVNARCIGDVKAGPGEGQLTLATQCSHDAMEQKRGFVVYDIADPASPAQLTIAPPGTACHMVDVAVVGGESYVYCAAQLGAQAWRLDETPLGLQPIPVNLNLPQEPTMLQHVPLAVDEFGTFGLSYFFTGPHDMTTQADPLTGEPIVVVSHSYSGVRILDGADPTLGRVLGVWNGDGAESYSWIHTAQAVDIGGKRIVVAITENVVNTPPRFWVIDFTDYANPVLLAEHHLAGQTDSQDLVYSLHNFQLVGTRMYMGAYHAGVWVLDLSDPAAPKEIAFALSGQPVYPKQDGEFLGIGNRWVDQVWDVVIKDGYAFASDMASGLHVYAVGGDPLGDDAYRSFG